MKTSKNRQTGASHFVAKGVMDDLRDGMFPDNSTDDTVNINFTRPSASDYIGEANPYKIDEQGHWSPSPTKLTMTQREFHEQYPLTLDQLTPPYIFKARASGASALFTGRKLFGPEQQRELVALMSKIELNKTETAKRTVLENARDSYRNLPVGAITYIHTEVDKHIYEYEDHISTKATEKGNLVEDEVIELHNLVFFTDYKKCGDEDHAGCNKYFTYHPDVLDKQVGFVLDAKAPWSKKTHPKSTAEAYDSGYDWQDKVYLYSMRVEEGIDEISCTENTRWTTGRIFFGLCDTPLELLEFSKEDLSMHEVNHLPLGLRATWFDVTLTDDDVDFMICRMKASQKEAARYRAELLSKI